MLGAAKESAAQPAGFAGPSVVFSSRGCSLGIFLAVKGWQIGISG